MMPFEQWLDCILRSASHVASREYQEKAWLPGGTVVSSPEEIYLSLMEDCTSDLFFETYGHRFNGEQLEAWSELRSRLEAYYDKLPRNPDRLRVLRDPEWDLVRESAKKFVLVFQHPSPEARRG